MFYNFCRFLIFFDCVFKKLKEKSLLPTLVIMTTQSQDSQELNGLPNALHIVPVFFYLRLTQQVSYAFTHLCPTLVFLPRRRRSDVRETRRMFLEAGIFFKGFFQFVKPRLVNISSRSECEMLNLRQAKQKLASRITEYSSHGRE